MTAETLKPKTGVARPARPVRRKPFRQARLGTLYLLLLPSFLLTAVFSYLPALRSLYSSLFDVDYGGSGRFIGLRNFVDLWHDEIFRQCVWNLAIFTGALMVVSVTVPLAVAELIFGLRSRRAQHAYRVMVLLPVVVPGLVLLLIWQFIYDGDDGLLNALLRGIGLDSWQHAWLADIDTALAAVIGTGFPFISGLGVLTYVAGLQSIDSEVFTAAAVDGASGFRRFWTIDRPLLIGQIRLNLILAVVGGAQAFVGPLVLTQGGPANASNVPGLYLYQQAFTLGRLGYGSAIGVELFLAVLLLTVAFNTVLKKRW